MEEWEAYIFARREEEYLADVYLEREAPLGARVRKRHHGLETLEEHGPSPQRRRTSSNPNIPGTSRDLNTGMGSSRYAQETLRGGVSTRSQASHYRSGKTLFKTWINNREINNLTTFTNDEVVRISNYHFPNIYEPAIRERPALNWMHERLLPFVQNSEGQFVNQRRRGLRGSAPHSIQEVYDYYREYTETSNRIHSAKVEHRALSVELCNRELQDYLTDDSE